MAKEKGELFGVGKTKPLQSAAGILVYDTVVTAPTKAHLPSPDRATDIPFVGTFEFVRSTKASIY